MTDINDLEWRVKLTIDYTKLDFTGVSSLNNFPIVLVANGSNSVFPSDMWNGQLKAAKSDWGDVRFYDSDFNELAFDIAWLSNASTPANRRAEIHVRVPSIDDSTDTEIYMAWGNSSLNRYTNTDTYGRNNTWSEYEAVYHFNETASTDADHYVDSTGNGYDLTSNSATAVTRVDGSPEFKNYAADFDGSSAARLVCDSITTWSNRFLAVTARILMDEVDSQTINYPWSIADSSGNNVIQGWLGGSNSSYDNIGLNKAGGLSKSDSVFNDNDEDIWKGITWRYDSSVSDIQNQFIEDQTIHSNDTNDATGTFSGFDTLKVGCNIANSWNINGKIEEFRIAATSVTNYFPWIKSTHQILEDPYSYIATGSVEDQSSSSSSNSSESTPAEESSLSSLSSLSTISSSTTQTSESSLSTESSSESTPSSATTQTSESSLSSATTQTSESSLSSSDSSLSSATTQTSDSTPSSSTSQTSESSLSTESSSDSTPSSATTQTSESSLSSLSSDSTPSSSTSQTSESSSESTPSSATTQTSESSLSSLSSESSLDLQFVSVWQTTTDDESITLPLVSGQTYDFTVDWGDGNTSTITSDADPDATHTYTLAGTYTVKCIGVISDFIFNNSGDTDKIIEISNWGNDITFNVASSAFYGCSNLKLTATDAPNISANTLFQFFRGCLNLTADGDADLSEWDVSSVTSLNRTFFGVKGGNDINVTGWDVSSVTALNLMAHSCTCNFVGLSGWDVSSVKSFEQAFAYANPSNLDVDLSSWNTASATSFLNMFRDCTSLTWADISTWTFDNVTSAARMFQNATNADPKLSSSQNFSNVVSFQDFGLNSGHSVDNYTEMLGILYDQRFNLNTNVPLGTSAEYCSSYQDQRDYLTDTLNWTITDAGATDCGTSSESSASSSSSSPFDSSSTSSSSSSDSTPSSSTTQTSESSLSSQSSDSTPSSATTQTSESSLSSLSSHSTQSTSSSSSPFDSSSSSSSPSTSSLSSPSTSSSTSLSTSSSTSLSTSSSSSLSTSSSSSSALETFECHAKITIDVTQFEWSTDPNGDIRFINFPLLLADNGLNSCFPSEIWPGAAQPALSDWGDVRFFDEDFNQIPFEIAYLNNTSVVDDRRAEVYVCVPLIEKTDTERVIYIAWGDPTLSRPSRDDPLIGSELVWDKHTAVYHFTEKSDFYDPGVFKDSTSNHYDFTSISHEEEHAILEKDGIGSLRNGSIFLQNVSLFNGDYYHSSDITASLFASLYQEENPYFIDGPNYTCGFGYEGMHCYAGGEGDAGYAQLGLNIGNTGISKSDSVWDGNDDFRWKQVTWRYRQDVSNIMDQFFENGNWHNNATNDASGYITSRNDLRLNRNYFASGGDPSYFGNASIDTRYEEFRVSGHLDINDPGWQISVHLNFADPYSFVNVSSAECIQLSSQSSVSSLSSELSTSSSSESSKTSSSESSESTPFELTSSSSSSQEFDIKRITVEFNNAVDAVSEYDVWDLDTFMAFSYSASYNGTYPEYINGNNLPMSIQGNGSSWGSSKKMKVFGGPTQSDDDWDGYISEFIVWNGDYSDTNLSQNITQNQKNDFGIT